MSKPLPQLTVTRRQRWGTLDFVLIAVTAALYAAALLVTANIKLGVPGTSLRPGNALQAVFGMLFGLPGAIGTGLGNLIHDLFTGQGKPHILILGTLMNFLAAYLPFLLVSRANLKSARSWIEFYLGAVLLTSALVGFSIWINVWLGFTPAQVAGTFGPIVFLNQLIPTAIISPILLKLLYPFVRQAGLFRGKDVD